MYSKVFLIRNSRFPENAKRKVYALEDCLGEVYFLIFFKIILFVGQNGGFKWSLR